jgi:hypothetical protein
MRMHEEQLDVSPEMVDQWCATNFRGGLHPISPVDSEGTVNASFESERVCPDDCPSNPSVFVVTGGGTEFVRAIGSDFYGVDPERIVGSLIKYEVSHDDNERPVLLRTTDLFGELDEGAAKVSNIQIGLGRRPILAAGNSPGDTEMLDYAMAADGPTMALLVNHDDAKREYAYEGEAVTFETSGSFTDIGREKGWNVVSMRDDWKTIFASPS